MTETDEKGKKKLSLSSGGTLSLGKKIETSQVKQSFSHGRSKTVQVERRRKRAPIAQKLETQPLDENQALKNLTSEERAARTRALKEGLQQQENQTDKETETNQVQPELIAEDTKSTEGISVSTPKEIVTKSVEGPVQTKDKEDLDGEEEALEEEQKILEAARLAEEEEARLAKATSNRQLGRSSEKSSAAQNESDNEESIEDENETSKSTKKRIESGKKLAVPPAGGRAATTTFRKANHIPSFG